MGVVRSSTGITQYLTACQAIDTECTTIAYPATICMNCQAAEGTDDEASVETPKIPQETLEKEMDGKRPVTPIEQMREEIFKGKETEATLLEDETVEEEDDLCDYLGIKVTKLPDGTIMLNQPHLIDAILTDLNLQSTRTTGRSTPALSSILLHQDSKGIPFDKSFHYRSIIGKLNFLEKSTRDLCCASMCTLLF